ncbi:MAG: 3-deoxy-D-manno-octulosonic acid transferase [Planctomycetales bacterium]
MFDDWERRTGLFAKPTLPGAPLGKDFPLFAWLLNLIYLALLAVLAPWIVVQMSARGKYRRGLSQKLWGALPRREGDRPCLWLHAVSVGEVLQLRPVVDRLTKRRPDLEIVISVTTTTGHDVARERFPHLSVVYFPLDFSWGVNRALDRIRPDLIGLVELELWPNFLQSAARREIPVLLINGRISERSHRGYRRIRPFVRRMLLSLRLALMQNRVYAERLEELGADPRTLSISGSIKFDNVETERSNPRTRALREALRIGPGERVFIAGSTQPPEEELAIHAWLQARRRHPDLRLILVPRHKERFEEVARLVEEQFRLPLLRRTRTLGDAQGRGGETPGFSGEVTQDAPAIGAAVSSGAPVVLLDTLGELSACWGLATVAFVGGSLTRRGGQNMIEPAGYGAAVLFGPNTANFKDVVELLLVEGAALVVGNQQELTRRLEELLADPDQAQQMGRRAQALVLAQRGATDRTVEAMERLLDESRPTSSAEESRAA